MKIVHICLCGPYNDGWNYQENIIPYYHKKMGHEVTIVTTPFINDKKSIGYLFYKTGEYYDDNGIKVIRKPLKFSNKSRISKRFRLYKGLYKSLEYERPDTIFIHGLQFLDIRFIVKYAKKHHDVKIYVDGHEDFNNSARNWLSKYILHGVIWKYCAHLIEPYTIRFWGVLPARVDFLINMYKLPPSKVDLLVMGAEDEKVNEARNPNIRKNIRKKFNINDDDFLIVTGGKIDQNKPQTLLLMESINKLGLNKVKLIVFGSVSTNLQDRFYGLISDSIQFIGWIDAKELYKYFNSAELVVFPGLHSVLWEQAVGQGVPCVFKYIDGFNHIDLGGNCMFIYEDSVDEIKQVLTTIISNKELYCNMKDVAKSKGMNFFSYRKIAKRSIDI